MTDNELLQEILKQVKNTNAKVDNLENRFDNLENRFDNLENRFDNLENDVKSIKVTIETEIRTNIKLLAEGYGAINNKVDSLVEDVEVLKFDVDVVKSVVTTHSSKLRALKEAL